MKEISATDAARRFSEVLDAIEHRGQSFIVVRNGKPVAQIRPAPRSTLKDLIGLLRRHPPDPDWARDIAEVRKLLVSKDVHWND